jgi:hypothetical protein
MFSVATADTISYRPRHIKVKYLVWKIEEITAKIIDDET